MADAFDERRKGLEDEYFKRKNRESLEKLRAALHEEAKSKGAGAATLACPRCDGRLHEVAFDDVRIDRCDKCEGLWLDAGELERIIGQENAAGHWLSAFWPGRTRERAPEE